MNLRGRCQEATRIIAVCVPRLYTKHSIIANFLFFSCTMQLLLELVSFFCWERHFDWKESVPVCTKLGVGSRDKLLNCRHIVSAMNGVFGTMVHLLYISLNSLIGSYKAWHRSFFDVRPPQSSLFAEKHFCKMLGLFPGSFSTVNQKCVRWLSPKSWGTM